MDQITCPLADSIFDVNAAIIWLAAISLFFLFHSLLNVLIRERSSDTPKAPRASSNSARSRQSNPPPTIKPEHIKRTEPNAQSQCGVARMAPGEHRQHTIG